MASDTESHLLQLCTYGSLCALKDLITKQGLNPNEVKDSSGFTLHLACQHGHLDIVQYLIKDQNCNPEPTTPKGCTPLHTACKSGHLLIVKCLITDHKCNPHCTDNDGYTPLHAASESGNIETVKYLITEQGCDPNAGDSIGNIPLHYASESGHLHIVQHLITNFNSDPNMMNSRGSIPLHYACRGGQTTVARYLIDEHQCSPNCTNMFGNTSLHLACLNSCLPLVKYLIEEHVCNAQSVNNNGLIPLHYACLNGHLDITKYLILVCNCNPQCSTNNGNTPLHFACQNGHLEVVKHLITEYKCSPEHGNVNGYTPLHSAASSGHLTVVKCLICELCCNPQIADNAGYTPLHFACLNGHLDITKYLISDCKCDPQYSASNGNTPLHYACLNGHLDITKYLILVCNCNPQCSTNNGNTPLHFACQNGHLEVVKHLITEYKCSPEHGNVNGYTPLHSAASSGHLTVVKCLICELCCNPQIADNAGYTPLHFACLNGHLDITKYLISDCNCNPQHSTNRGNTPLHYACQNGHLEVVKHLITEYKCSPEHGNVNGYTPLHSAASSGHLTVVKCLICELCCNPQIADNAGYTPLHFACLNGHLDITKYLISDCNCNPQHSTNRGNTPLHYACENGHLEVAKYLITEYKCSPEHGNVYGYTPLHSATSNGHLDIVKYLISQHNCNPQCRDNDDSTPLHEACSSGHLNIAEYLIEEKNCACEPMAIINDEMLAAATKREGFPLQSSLMVKAYETFLFVKYMHGWTTREIATSKAIEGITPLHFACMKGHLDTVKYLISTCKCNPNHATSNGFTAIDFAQICKHKEVVSYLRNEHQCSSSWSQALQANPFDFNFSYCLACNDEMCISPLQQACIIGDLETVKSCITKSDSNPSSAGLLGLTPLHTACMMGHLEIAKYLVFECKCDPNCAIVGTTPQTISITPHYQNTFITPLTVATAWGQLDIIKWLVSELKCNPECNENDFPLDILACMFGQLDVLKYLLHESGFQDLPGLLFAACCFGDLNIVKYLIDECKCDPHFRSGDGAISLHFACSDVQHLFKNKNQPSEKITTSNLSINGIILHIWQAIIFPVTMVTQLVRNLVPGFPNPAKQTNNYDILSDAMWPNRKNRSGEQFKNPKLDIVNYLITEHKCNPQCTDKEGQTPLHYACASGQHETVQYFHTEKLSDLVHTAHSGDTPLHFACKYNHAEVVQFLLSTGECDPLIKNVEGLTPVEFATSPEIRNLLDHFCKGKYPLGSVVKVFVLGDPMAGKSSLVQAIQSNPGFLSSLIGRFKKVKGARQQTVGIDSVSFSSSDFGNVVIYDFAGQREFYTSHAAFLQSYSFHMEGIFIVVTDITHCEDDISQSLQYWVSFIQDCCTHSKIKPHVIFVGSHVDQLDLGSIERVINTIEQNFSVNNFYETEAIICLDCTQPASPQLDLLRYHLEESCDAIREKTEKIDQRCYVLHKYVLKAYINKGVSGCRLKTFSKELEGNPYLLPSNPSELLSLFKTLHDKGQVLLLRNDHDISDSWVITNIAALLETVVGSIFAPRDFPQHIAPGSTGIVPKSRMSEAFPDFNIDMVIGFLEHFEFCHRVEPECDSLSNQTMSDDEYYLFPALLTSEEIPHILQENYESSYCCGWFMYSAVGQFFTTRFLHVLLVRLAFLFAPPQVDATPSRIKVPALRRRCKMWKNGISWPDTNGVIVVFELKDLKTATLRMTCMKGREIHCVRLHTSLIRAILKTKNEFCPRVHVEECIMDVTPGNLTAVLECPSYSIRYLSAVIASRHSQGDPDLVLTNSDGSTGKRISELLYFEPYAVLTAELIKQLFAKDNTKKLVSSSFITELACRMYPFNDSLEQVLTPDPSILSRMYKEHHLEILGELYRQQLRCQRILEAWVEQLGPAATYKKLRQELNEYSIFCGRNPLFLSVENGDESSDSSGEDDIQIHDYQADRPTLIECVRFRGRERKINIPQEIGTKYYNFGLFLLEDDTGLRMHSLANKHMNDVEQINMEVLQEWITGRGKHPVIWKTLTDVLHDIELRKLAKEIEDIKCHGNTELEAMNEEVLNQVNPPKVVQHPENQSIIPGKDIDFSIEATGDNLQFQWQKNGSDLSDGDKYHGVHTDTLHIMRVTEGDKGCYRCLVMNNVETKFSHEALLTEMKQKVQSTMALMLDSSYRLDGVEETSEELGTGAFGLITAVKYKGMKCAAKELHINQCMLHLQLHHPHIVQSLGYYKQHQAHVLVMELLNTDLGRYIDRYGVLPNEIVYSILHDVALGLQYLHERFEPIVHRCLMACNVLLSDDMTAKIGGFGSAIVLTLFEVNSSREPVPENPVYMISETSHDVKLDIFSFGILMVHLLSGQKPSDLKEQTQLEGHHLPAICGGPYDLKEQTQLEGHHPPAICGGPFDLKEQTQLGHHPPAICGGPCDLKEQTQLEGHHPPAICGGPYDLKEQTQLEGHHPSAICGGPYDLKEQQLEGHHLKRCLEAIGTGHSLMVLISQCLSNDPAERPVASEIHDTLNSHHFPAGKLEALYKLQQRERNQRKQEACTQSFETILSKAMKNIPASKIASYLSSLAFTESISEDQPTSKVIEAHSSYLNYHLVGDMVENFGDDELKADMRKYLTDLKKFRKQTTVSDFVVISHGKHVKKFKPLRENYTELSVKLNEEKENTTMEDVERIRKDIAHELSLPPHALLFYAVEEGSVIARFWIESRKIYNLKHKSLVELEKKDDILEITVDDGERLEMKMKESDLCLNAGFESQQQHELDGVVQKLSGSRIEERLREENLTLGKENETLQKKIKELESIQSGESAVQTEGKLNDNESGSGGCDILPEHMKLKIQSLEDENEKLRRQLDNDKLKSSYNRFLGVEVVGEEQLQVTNEGMNFQWKDHGFKLHVPKNALPEDISEYSVNIKASLAGQFELPEGYELVSAVYWVKTPGKFAKPTTIEVQHCANFSDPNQLCFVRTSCAQKSLPYKFKVINGGSFILGTKCGALSTIYFSGIGIAKEEMSGVHSCQYCAQVYFTVKNLRNYWYYCHFVVTKDLEMCLAVVKRKYQQEYDIAPPITFDGDHVALDIPDDGTQTENGWEIVPVHKANIKKDRVDNFSSESTWVPECVLLLEWKQKDSAPEPLKYKVKLMGTGEKSDFFRIVYNPDTESTQKRQAEGEGVPLSVTHQQQQQQHVEESPVEKQEVKLKSDDEPTLSQLLKFPGKRGKINIPERIGTNYKTFGIFLLNDGNGAKVESIAKEEGDLIHISLKILSKWLQGEGMQPPTWTTIIEALEMSNLGALAKDIRAVIEF